MICLLLRRGADLDALSLGGYSAEDYARHTAAALLRDVRLAGGWRGYVHEPRKRLLSLRILAERDRAETKHELLVHLFPSPVKNKKNAGKTHKAVPTALPTEVLWHILSYWRSDRDLLAADVDAGAPPTWDRLSRRRIVFP